MTAARQLALVGGHFVAGRDDRWTEVVDPADVREVIGLVPEMTTSDVLSALDAAVAGRDAWAKRSPIERGQILYRATQVIRSWHDDMTTLIVRECGKMRHEASVEVTKAADFFEYYAGFGRLSTGTLLPDARPRVRAWAEQEPVGVVVAITPFNDPLLTPARKVAPALIAGNSVILKPASQTPLIALRLAEALHEAGIPAGVMNVVTGRVDPAINALLDDERVAAITFTGSTENGRRLSHRVAGRNTRLQVELGGKNTAVVLADADLDRAARTIVAAAFAQAGQRCTATSRVLVEHTIHDALVEAVLASTGEIQLGPGSETSSTMGPLIDQRQVAWILGSVQATTNAGARVIHGGREAAGTLEPGCFVEPTLIVDVPLEAPAWTDELFGPVVAIRPVTSLDAAITEINRSRYGLATSLFTSNLDAADAFIRQVDTGQVAINLPTAGWDVHLPFGGFRDSGSAWKEQGVEAIDFYTRVKTVAIAP